MLKISHREINVILNHRKKKNINAQRASIQHRTSRPYINIAPEIYHVKQHGESAENKAGDVQMETAKNNNNGKGEHTPRAPTPPGEPKKNIT